MSLSSKALCSILIVESSMIFSVAPKNMLNAIIVKPRSPAPLGKVKNFTIIPPKNGPIKLPNAYPQLYNVELMSALISSEFSGYLTVNILINSGTTGINRKIFEAPIRALEAKVNHSYFFSPNKIWEYGPMKIKKNPVNKHPINSISLFLFTFFIIMLPIGQRTT